MDFMWRLRAVGPQLMRKLRPNFGLRLQVYKMQEKLANLKSYNPH